MTDNLSAFQLDESGVWCLLQQEFPDSMILNLPNEAAILEAGKHLSYLLPVELRRHLHRFATDDLDRGYIHLTGFPVNVNQLHKTPQHWSENIECIEAIRFWIWQAAIGWCLGEPFGWETKQNGSIINKIVPIKTDAEKQLSSGSSSRLNWHVEDGPDNDRADFLTLGCLRNPDMVATELSVSSDWELSKDDRRFLGEDAYLLAIDVSHSKANNTSSKVTKYYDSEHTPSQSAKFKRIKVLYGDPMRPFAIFDPEYMSVEDSEPHRSALDRLVEEVEAKAQRLVLAPGDVLIIDNYRTAHARESFTPRFDGTDRWLSRIMLKRGLRSSKERHVSGESVLKTV